MLAAPRAAMLDLLWGYPCFIHSVGVATCDQSLGWQVRSAKGGLS